jgi:hypothetical protein
LIVAAVVLLLLTQSAVLGQDRSRVVKSPSCPYLEDSVLIEILSLSVGDREVSFDQLFVAGDDWLTRLKFRIVNRGSKPIAAIMMTVGLLEGVDETLPTNASFDYGMQFFRINEVKAKRGRSKLVDLVRPGQEIEITAEGSKPYGLRYMDAMLSGATRAKNWTEFVSKAGTRFHRMEVMAPTIWFTDRSEGTAELLVREKCDGKK